MANGWTLERRASQAIAIQSWKPWEKSTGPRTDEGKQRVARNAYTGGSRQILRGLSRCLRELDKRQRDRNFLRGVADCEFHGCRATVSP